MKKMGLLRWRSRSQESVQMLVLVHMISSKLPNIWLPDLVLWCIIMSWSVMQKDWFAILKVNVTTTKKHPKNPWILSRWYLLNHKRSFSKLGIVMHHSESECHAKRLIAIFKVKVTARAHTIKWWQFLLYLLNCWSFCYQTWFESTLS